MIFELMLGFYLAVVIAGIAWWRKALDAGGAIAATITGTIIFGLGGLGPSVALIAFFVSGSVLSRLPHKSSMVYQMESLGRTWRQVLANGLVPACMLVASVIFRSKESVFLVAYYGALSTSCADTWGTEIGIRFGKRPRDILTGLEIETGLSGGISVAGTAATMVGAALIVLCSVLSFMPLHFPHIRLALFSILLAGTLGALADSILGASIQAKYHSNVTGRISEFAGEADAGATSSNPIAGYRLITNNAVNLLSAAIGAVLSIILFGFS